MEIKIGKKNYQLKFGLKCIRELDKVYKVDTQGLQFGMGVNLAVIQLQTKSVSGLSNVIKAAISHTDDAPNIDKVDAAVEKYAEENDGLNKLFNEIQDEMGKSPVMKETLKDFQEKAKEEEAKQES
jgi:hypothetical protein